MQRHIKNWERWKANCATILRGNLPNKEVLKKLNGYHYTCPAKEKGHYLPQWLWDSCFHAMVYRWFDPDMAWKELQALFVHQVMEGADIGMVPHMAHFEANDDKVNQRLFRNLNRSMITQPPLIAIAALAVHKKSPRKDILKEMYLKIKSFHNWFDRRRDPDGDNLVTIIHPWESGWDASQRWDKIMGVTEATSEQLSTLGNKRQVLIDLILDHQCNPELLANIDNSFYVEPVDFNAIRAADLEALAKIAEVIGKDTKEQNELKQQVKDIRRAVRKKMVHKEDGKLYVHDLIGAEEKKSSSDSAAKFVLMFGKCLEPEDANLLRDTLEDDRSPFKTKYPVPTTPTNDPSFDGEEYWRGNVWLPVNWLIYTGLRNYGFVEESQRLAQKSLDLVENSGFCEFFDPITGARGEKLGDLCPQNQSWSTIILDMLGNEKSGP